EKLEREPRAVRHLDAAEVLRVQHALAFDRLMRELLVDGRRERLDVRKQALHVTRAQREEVFFAIDPPADPTVGKHLLFGLLGYAAHPIAHIVDWNMSKNFR